ncbi:MAG: NAD-dependent epimerase/dehydratase family protein [Anaerolineae bacterium]|nr:NAD-dependent epimerase/dehydratase family protein [Anaerolineae bacterium]
MSLSSSTVLVTGATGFLGGVLAQRLAAEGAQVRALARSPQKAGLIRGLPGIEIVEGDITDADRMRAVTQGCRFVFHAAAAFGDWTQQRRVNVAGTRHVLLAAAAANVERVVFVSSIAVYGYAQGGILTEETPLIPTQADPYSMTKAEAEDVVRTVAAEHDLSYAIIRPGMIYGPHSPNWTDGLFRLARRRPVWWVGDGSGSTFPIYVDDVADLMARLAVHPAAHQQTFNAVNADSVTWREFLLGYARLAGHQSWLGIPLLPVKGLAQLVGWLSPSGSRLKAAPDALRSLYSQRTMTMSKARDRLGWQPQIDLATGLERCVPSLREKGWLR